MNRDVFDVTIIGGGPAGLYSAFYSGLRQMKTKIIEFQPTLGGKVHIYPEKMIWDIGGLPPLPGAKLIENIVQQGLTFNPEVVLNEKVISMEKDDEGLFILKTESGLNHYSKTVIAAIGSGILKPHKLSIEGADRFEVTNLHYTVKSLQYFLGKTVIISGGGNAAVDWANELVPVAKKVYLTHRKSSLTGHEASVEHLENSSADIFFDTSITNLLAGKDERIHKVELTNHQTDEAFLLPIDEVIINHGFDRDASLLEDSSLTIDMRDNYYISCSVNSESSIPGLYGAGDIMKHDGKLHLIAGAFQDAANAVNKAKQYIEPTANEQAMVSSHNEVFNERNKQLVSQLLQKA